MDATVVLFRCSYNKKPFGVRIQRMNDGDWWRTWAFELQEATASREGYGNTQVHGNLYCTKEYPGCPYCEADSFVRCGSCGNYSCWHNEETVVCPWCGTIMDNITPAEDGFTIKGNEF